jgi:hypothetical protein
VAAVILNAYERQVLQGQGQGSVFFLYAANFKDSNNLQIGFGYESGTGLQRSHIAGPLVHEHHVTAFTDWLRTERRVELVSTLYKRSHPLTSSGQTEAEYKERLGDNEALRLNIDRFEAMIDDFTVTPDRVERFSDLILRIRNKVWGHPADWDVRHVELLDGRFVWMAYDNEIKKIRVGLGFHSPANEKQYGLHTYAIGKAEAAQFSAFHYTYMDAPLQFMGLPPRWPSELSPFLLGDEKQKFATGFLKLADEIWPGEVYAADPV